RVQAADAAVRVRGDEAQPGPDGHRHPQPAFTAGDQGLGRRLRGRTAPPQDRQGRLRTRQHGVRRHRHDMANGQTAVDRTSAAQTGPGRQARLTGADNLADAVQYLFEALGVGYVDLFRPGLDDAFVLQ